MPVINAELYNAEPEVLSSKAVYDLVLPYALELADGASESYNQLYGKIGVRRVELKPTSVELCGHRGWTSDQSEQDCGSYKVRGAGYAVLEVLKADPQLEAVHICSQGNAANGTLQAAKAFGLNVICETTKGASLAKVEPLRKKGAVVNAVHDEFEDGRQAAILHGEQPGHAVIEAYDQAETIAGQATIGWETLQDLVLRANKGEVDLHNDPVKLFVPVGGGGLIAGIAVVMKHAKEQGLIGDNVQVVGVQMEGCDAAKRHRDYVLAGYMPPEDLFSSGPEFNTECDGTAVRRPGKLTAAIINDPGYVADVLTVTPGELGIAMDQATRIQGVNVEPAGALSLAGAKKYAAMFPRTGRAVPETLITFTTGANVSPDLYGRFMGYASATRQARQQAEIKSLDRYKQRLLDLGAVSVELSEQPFAGRRGTRVSSAPSS